MLIAFYTYRIPPRLQNRGADPLVRAGPPGPATSSLDEYQWQADVGVGRGPGVRPTLRSCNVSRKEEY
jgi:hypothetical protein